MSHTKHPEIKSLLILGGVATLLLSQMSFFFGHPEQNWLGLFGYSLGFLQTYLLGIGSYFLLGVGFYLGVKVLLRQKVEKSISRALYFSLFVVSVCLLANLFAETQGLEYSFFQDRVVKKEFAVNLFQTKTHYYLGGRPLYYLYTDLPSYNLRAVLSNVGIFFIFSMSAVLSLLLIFNLQLHDIWNGLKTAACASFGFFRKLAQSFRLPDLEPNKVPRPKRAMNSKRFKPHFEPPKTLPQEEAVKETPPPLPELLETAKPKPKMDKPSVEKKKYRGEYKSYRLPPLTLLTNAKKVDQPTLKKDLQRQAQVLEETLASFGIEAKVGEVNCGPTITSFEVHPAVGVKVQKIKALENDLALNMEAPSIRIIAPIPGKAAVGVEIPSLHPQEVGFKEMLASYKKNSRKFHIPILLGKTVSGEDVTCELAKWPHAIIAGATGSGKSVCINTLIMSILMNARPDEIKLILIDPKKVELTPYAKLPHMIAPVITEAHGAYAALSWLVKEMQHRYEILKQLGLRNITAFNNRKPNHELEESLSFEVPNKMPMIVCIIDEFADLMMTSSSDLETPIARIAQMARAVGIHLILATQRPSREVITGIIKANFPTRIAFKVASRVNSQIILDENGAESLLGNGDALFLPPGTSQLIRSQGAYIRDEDINRVISYIADQAGPDYLIKSFDNMSREDLSSMGGESDEPRDELFDTALTIVLQSKTASTTFLQRKLKIGYARAASLMDELESRGIIGPQEGSRPRKVLVDSTELL